MSVRPPQSRILEAVEALKALDRERAVRLLQEELRHGPPAGDRWKSVSRLAAQIGEIEIALESAKRYANTSPVTLERKLSYWGELARYGRTHAAREELGQLPPASRRPASVLHFLGTLAAQEGDFVAAEGLFREALAQAPHLPETWFALAMIKTFAPGDTDIAAMEAALPAIERAAPALRARFLYGLAKARHDCGDYDRAFALYSQGAALRRQDERWDPAAYARVVDAVIEGFTPQAMEGLIPSGEERPALLVNGLPRSGTTLVEQIIVSHSRVADGAEVNLLRAALIPAGDCSPASALRYQQRAAGGDDPWGALGATYLRLLEMRFQTPKLVVDKTLGQSHLVGLLLHMLPNARIVWMRRDPEDTALSCFRTFFTAGVPWSWSLEDIGRYFKLEDRLHAHWSAMFPGRILTVDYEALVAEPQQWIPRIAAQCGLEPEPPMFEAHKTERGVLTASVQQVREPMTTARIGLSAGYSAQLEPFRRAYFG